MDAIGQPNANILENELMLKPQKFTIEWRLRPAAVYSPYATSVWSDFKTVEHADKFWAEIEVEELNSGPDTTFEFRLKAPHTRSLRAR